jgi:hypothetical protein
MYVYSYFKSKSKRETSATLTWQFEGMNMVFAKASRILSRSIDVFIASRGRTKSQGRSVEAD